MAVVDQGNVFHRTKLKSTSLSLSLSHHGPIRLLYFRRKGVGRVNSQPQSSFPGKTSNSVQLSVLSTTSFDGFYNQ